MGYARLVGTRRFGRAVLATGAILGDFRIEDEIGRGGMGVVYRATQVSLGRPVALKVISETLSDRDDFRERFVRESRLAASLDHPNVVPIYDAGEDDGVLYIAMRFVHGTDLRSLIVAEGAFDPASAPVVVSPVASALDAAHERRLVHRDVKPANILLAASRRRRARLPDRFRADEANGFGQRPDRRWRVGWNARLRGSGAGPGRAGRRTSRCLRTRLRALRTAHRSGAVRARRRHSEALGPYLGPSALAARPGARDPAGAGECGRPLHGEGSGRPLRDRRADGAGGSCGGARSRGHRHARSHGSGPARRGAGWWGRHSSRRDGSSGVAAGRAPPHSRTGRIDRGLAPGGLRRSRGRARGQRRFRFSEWECREQQGTAGRHDRGSCQRG